MVAELLLVFNQPAVCPVALGAVFHYVDGQRFSDGAGHGAYCVMMVVWVESDAAASQQFFRALDIIGPALKDDHCRYRTALCSAHMLPVHRWTRVQDHAVFQTGNNLSRWNYIHQYRVS